MISERGKRYKQLRANSLHVAKRAIRERLHAEWTLSMKRSLIGSASLNLLARVAFYTLVRFQ